MTEIRYWPRIGMPVDKAQAEEIIHRMEESTIGQVLDEDLEEFQTVVPVSSKQLLAEVEDLFDNPPADDVPAFSEDNLAILELMEYEESRKQFIIDAKEKGMTLEEAKEAYESGKAILVRDALGLPEDLERKDVLGYSDESE